MPKDRASPGCLVADEHDISTQGRRQKAPTSQPILEINPTHPVVQ
jgi:hypothetical protein